MQINSVSKQSFGVRPDNNTKFLLFQMEKNDIDTKPITDIMNKIYVGKTISTNITSHGEIKMDIYDKGDQIKSLITRSDGITLNPGTFKPENPKSLAKKLLSVLNKADKERTDNMKIWDKINFNLNERLSIYK